MITFTQQDVNYFVLERLFLLVYFESAVNPGMELVQCAPILSDLSPVNGYGVMIANSIKVYLELCYNINNINSND